MFDLRLFVGSSILLLCCLHLSQAHVVLRTAANDAEEKTDQIIQGYQQILAEIVKKHSSVHTLVLVYDQELDQSKISSDFIQELHTLNIIITNINIRQNKASQLRKTFGVSGQSNVVETLLRLLYGYGKVGMGTNINTRYIFIIWVLNPNILYQREIQPSIATTPIHPGWSHFDRVFLVQTGISNIVSKQDVVKMEFWKHIPRITGLNGSSRNKNLINIYLVDVFNGVKESSYKQLCVWIVNEKRLYMSRKNKYLTQQRFSTFEGEHLPVGTVWKDPFLIWGNKLHPYMDGLDWRLLKLVERHLNFTGYLVNTEKIGRLENGNWTGLLGLLANDSVSFAIGGIPVTPERLHAFQFSTTYYTDAYTFISPEHLIKPKVLDVFQQPFQEKVWIALGITGLCIVAALFLLANIEKCILKSRIKEVVKEDKWFTRLENNIAFFATQVLQKPYHHSPKSNALKFIFYGTSLGIHIMGIMFVTFMIVNMSKPLKRVAIDKVDEIVPSRISLDIRDYDGELNNYLRREKPEIIKSAYLVNWFESCTSLKSVSEGTRIYMDSRARLTFAASYEYNKKKIFSFHLASEDVLGGVNLAWGMKKNWPFHRAINKVIVSAVESGLVHYWMGNFKRGKFAWDGNSEALSVAGEQYLVDWSSVIKKLPPKKELDLHYKYEPIASKELRGVLLMYETGCIVSIVVFFLENVVSFLGILLEMLTWLTKEICQTCLNVIITCINSVKRTKNLLREKLTLRTRPSQGKKRSEKWARKCSRKKNTTSTYEIAHQNHNQLDTTTPRTQTLHRARQRSQSATSATSWYSFDTPFDFNYLK